MTSANQVRARWDAGARADIIAIINGGGVDLDDSGTPLDDQWELIADQLDTAPVDQPAPDPEPERPPLDAAAMAASAAEVASDLDPNAWKIGLSPSEIQLIARLREAKDLARAGHDEAAQLRGWATESEREQGLEGDLRYVAHLRQEAADADDAAERQLNETIRAAVPKGQKPLIPVEQVASITGLTRSRIYQIRDDRR